MTLHAKKGYLPLQLLLLVLLPSLVVSRNPKQRPVNEASSFDALVDKQPEGLATIGSRALIARLAEEVSASARMKKSTSNAGSAVISEQLFPVALHQQSTNAVAAKRDLQYKQPRALGSGRIARGAGDSRMIVRDSSNLDEKRAQGRFLPGQINELSTSQHQDEDSIHDNEDDVEESRAYRTRGGFVPPRIVYATSMLPEPFVRPGQAERGRHFGLTNFLIKGRTPMDPRSFKHPQDADESSSSDESTEESNIQVASTRLPMMIVNEAAEQTSQGYALYHRIVSDELGEKLASKVRSFEANSVTEDDPVTSSASMEKTEYDVDEQDWDAEETQSRKLFEEFENVGEPATESKYEFGYRVIDHGAGSDFGHEESRAGRVTNGRYHVLLPDGRVQRVEYFVDRGGYHADVTYAGHRREDNSAQENSSEEGERQ